METQGLQECFQKGLTDKQRPTLTVNSSILQAVPE